MLIRPYCKMLTKIDPNELLNIKTLKSLNPLILMIFKSTLWFIYKNYNHKDCKNTVNSYIIQKNMTNKDLYQVINLNIILKNINQINQWMMLS